MSLWASCPRCRERVEVAGDGSGECPGHGSQPLLWRPGAPAYETFAEHLRRSSGFPSYLPWPLAAGWRVTDFGVVVGPAERPVATITCTRGATELDGPVDVMVVAEEAGVGLGARCAGLPGPDPGPGFGQGPPSARLRVDSQAVPLWAVSTAGTTDGLDRSVVVGEAAGRWLWLVLTPAPAVLLLTDEWLLRDAAGEGPHLVAMPFEGPGPVW